MKSLLESDLRSTSEATGPFVVDLAEVDAGMLALVGGKAANLGDMIRAGLPVPPGFCVTTAAYRFATASDAIDFDALAGATAAGERQRDIARHARENIQGHPMPPEIAAAIRSRYARLGAHVPVAIRSSATAEDLPYASFAGQQDTYLHIIGIDAVLDHVRRCWASLWTERAVVYRASNGIDHQAVRLAVVVQRMVDAEVAGVLFTANPVTGRRRQAVIDASPGLGEAVVSGAVNPDRFVVDTANGQILERRLGDKRMAVRSLPGGGVEHVEQPASSNQSCLADEEIHALAALGDRVESHFGPPQDTEWAIDADRVLWLTQARPITTLFPLPARHQPTDDSLHVYLCFSLAQGLHRPITPMGMAAFRVLGYSAARLFGISVPDALAGPPVFAEAGQRLFIDLTGVLRGLVGRSLMPRILDVMEARSATVLRQLVHDPRVPLTKRSPLLFLRRAARIAYRCDAPRQILQALLRPAAAHRRVAQVRQDLDARLQVPERTTAQGRLDFAERVLASELIPLAPSTLPPAVAGLAMLGVADKLLGPRVNAGELETVLRGLPHNVTTEMDLALWDLATRIKKDVDAATLIRDSQPSELADRFRCGLLPEPAQTGLAGFLQLYGDRAVAEIDLGLPRWSDDPTHLLGVLANYLRVVDPEMAPARQFDRGAAAATAMIETLAGRCQSRWRAAAVRFVLGRARQLAGLREIAKYYLIVGFAAVRRQLSLVGSELARRGLLETPEDIFFLDFSEAREAVHGGGKASIKALVRDRRQAYEQELRRRHIPRVLLSDGTEPEADLWSSSHSGGLSGTPASSGTITGVARVVLDPVGAHLEPGEILVAPSTDPGWTPLFLTAGGLVMEMGGANSHGAVVAREYGIPAVVGVQGATSQIITGQRITVDGGAGRITVL